MDLTLVQQLLQSMVPDKAKPAVSTGFDMLRAKDEKSVVHFASAIMGQFQARVLAAPNEWDASLAVKHVITGITMAHCVTDPYLRKVLVEDYLAETKRIREQMRGAEVIDFFDHKARGPK